MKIKELGNEFFNDIFSNEFIVNQPWLDIIDTKKLTFSILHQKSSLITRCDDVEELKNDVIATLIDKEYTFNKLANTLNLEYNPIENYNRTETFTQRVETENTENTENTLTNGRVESGSTTNYGEQTITEINKNGERKESNTTDYGESSQTINNDYGAVSENVTVVKGQQVNNTINTLGSKVDATTSELGERVNTTEMKHGQQSITDNDTNTSSLKNFPFDLDIRSTTVDKERQHDVISKNRVISSFTDTNTNMENAVVDNVTTNYGEQTNEQSELKESYTDTEEKTTQEHTDISSTSISAKTDIVTNVKNAVEDNRSITNKEHEDSITSFVDETTDTNNGKRVGNGTETKEYELKTTGNIGVTTSQQMIQSERDIALFSFTELVKNAIVSTLVIGVWY